MSTQTPSFSTPPSVAAQIARLPEMPMAEIRALWQKLVGGEAPTHNRQFLERRIAYRLQELEFRKVEYRVIATADGQYDFQGRMYPSLSMIAREITGMRWSGPLFFGLKPPSNAKTKPTT